MEKFGCTEGMVSSVLTKVRCMIPVIIEGYLSDLWSFQNGVFTLEKGSGSLNASAIGGSSSVASPGGRSSGVVWVDGSGNAWLFGGRNSSSLNMTLCNSLGYLNDLWRFDGTNFMSVSAATENGYWGTKGQGNSLTIPSGRTDMRSWLDSDGSFWFFGGRTASTIQLIAL